MTSGCISLDECKIATGGLDTKTIVWDINTQTMISSLKQYKNFTTDMKWISNDNYVFIQISHDCTLKIYDTREMKQAQFFVNIGDFYATTFDIDSSGK